MDNQELEWLEQGGITSPTGFEAGAVYAGIKAYGDPKGRLDVALLRSTQPCSAAGVFTQSRVPGAPVLVSKEHLSDGRAQALVVNSGCANVALGERGLADARRMADLAAEKLALDPRNVLVASTGVIGRPLPMEQLSSGVQSIKLDADQGGAAFARAIMTTDTVPKACAVTAKVGEHRYTVGGVAKGSGMAHPDMATVFCFLTTDAPVAADTLQALLKRVADVSLNMVDIDMDTSTSDTMLVLANGAAGGEVITEGTPAAEDLELMMAEVAIALARDVARDGEGAKTLIEVIVEGAASEQDARLAARTVVSSPLVKTMVTGRDPNLGRVMMALGRSGAEIDVARTSVFIFDTCAFERGQPSSVDYDALSRAMDRPEVQIRVELGLGEGRATAWGCDLTAEYVRINADYTT